MLFTDLLKKVLIDYHKIGRGDYKPLYANKNTISLKILMAIDKILRKRNLAICRVAESSVENRINGLDWPANSDSMIGLKRMDNIEYCFRNVIKDSIPGDFIETGVWRGGAVIFMKALLVQENITDRIVWVADSFEGLPKPDDAKYKEDKGDKHHIFKELAISVEAVKKNFEKYGLLDDKVKFLKGWFKDTLPVAPISQLAIMRLDGDMYESTMDALTNLYHKLSKGGYVIIDDWALTGCKKAVQDFFDKQGIQPEIVPIDYSSVYWRK